MGAGHAHDGGGELGERRHRRTQPATEVAEHHELEDEPEGERAHGQVEATQAQGGHADEGDERSGQQCAEDDRQGNGDPALHRHPVGGVGAEAVRHDLAEGYVAAPARKHDEPEGNEAEYDGEGTHEGGVVACQRHHGEHTHGGGAGEGER